MLSAVASPPVAVPMVCTVVASDPASVLTACRTPGSLDCCSWLASCTKVVRPESIAEALEVMVAGISR